ncbi:MAG: conjugal transfer protein TraL [Desulfovibrionaceae bacterium]|nr:conjugal transfer protein TraL [Desulfovibrionaceae bacterium]
MATIHFILQGKGGVGKSLVASMLVQFLRLKIDPELVRCIDTDPVNHTLAGYREFNADILDIMVGDDIDARSFDQLMERIFELPEKAHMVVDNGASSFVPLCSYLVENRAISLLHEEGHQVFMHSIITGGQAITDTLSGLKSLAEHFGTGSNLMVWLNRYFGEIEINGSGFEEFKVYKDYQDKFHSMIEIPHRKQSTFGKDLESLLAEKISFDAAIHSTRPIMERQRIKSWWSAACETMEMAQFV